jgi:hypothetical protein
MDGSGKVSVPVKVDTESGPISYKMAVLPDDSGEQILRWIGLVTQDRAVGLDAAFEAAVLKSAEAARQDEEQLAELAAAQAKAAAGAKKSRRALDKRILAKKEEALKRAISDLMDRGVTRARLQQLIKDSIVEGVFKS